MLKKELESQAENEHDEEDGDKAQSFNHSASTLFIKKTITTESIFDIDEALDREEEESVPQRCLKYICYPLYLSSNISGRLRYFVDYVIILIIFGTMFMLSNSICFFAEKFPTNNNLVVLIFAGLLFYPIAGYFMKMSEGSNDYDFIGIIMHGVIIKFFLLSIALTLRSICTFQSI